ncbi:hypothetical protein BHQ15_17450 [Mycolicibacillus koreensis]|nr:hypothetical protein BHQ15_17450 [Mycolicibacillus koreensis]
MLTTTVDGIWVLQALSRIECLAPELGLRPLLVRYESAQSALRHPVADELRAAGAIGADGTVDAAVREWLTVLARRDVALVARIRRPGDGGEPATAILARCAQFWVVLERHADALRLSGVGCSRDHDEAVDVVHTQITRLCGAPPAAPIRPITVPAGVFGAATVEELSGSLADLILDGPQRHLMRAALDPRASAQASFVALQSGTGGAAPGGHVDPGAVTLVDTAVGRLLAEQVFAPGHRWMVIAPGTPTATIAAIDRMLQRLPARRDWHAVRRGR